ncbi:sensor histidine kinase [Marilutibacter chinensis]|uniref:histidine kinase n=1 Tax=Marilutibacter chinensis TaxID=2912247 RepID=A0ABS9HXG6_9GAMM|nr:HAMP domain-containing sensor histidine kinase [Lysobacter chinensis]MCF7223570.1 HAMP domain-containing histidine kinase [Lysobacter chinensis]
MTNDGGSRSARRPSLRSKILLAMVATMAVLSVAVVFQGLAVNEYVERIVWKTLLDGELDHLLQRYREEPGYRWVDSDNISLYGGPGGNPIPPALAGFGPGLHDDILFEDRVTVLLVRELVEGPVMLTLDAEPLEAHERELAAMIVAAALVTLLLAALAIGWSVSRLMRPLDTIAARIGALRPDRSGQRLPVPAGASREVALIAEAFDGFLERNDRFVERERDFINQASHELRTPVAVIAGATALALHEPGLPDAARGQLERIRRTARDVEQLISLLLVLAKDPERLAASDGPIALDALLPVIVDDHRHLAEGKDLTIEIAVLPPCTLRAPLPIVQAAIGNLLRNAIENSDRGLIRIRLERPARVVIEDPGHGMAPEEISAIYARMARHGDGGGGIGLELIARLCEHLHWRLDIASDRGQGTTTVLDLDTADADADPA